tara:strand:- start:1000 stop:2115 length:1116 start_codon:yes stop_codon:yes gene_type:complete
MKIAIFISDEGYGHSVRQKNIINNIFKLNPKIKITIFNSKRLTFLKEYFGNKIDYKHYSETLYTVKKKSGEMDLQKTKKVLQKWIYRSDLNIKNLIKKDYKFDLIISDLVPEAFRYAKYLNVPAFGVARFAWDWFFYNTKFRKLKSVRLISEDLALAKKIFFTGFVKKKILSSQKYSIKEVNLIFDKKIFNEGTSTFFKSKKKLKCLIMDNGTKTNSKLISDTIKYLKKISYIDFYVSIDNFSDKLKNIVAETDNLIPISGLKNMHRLIDYVDFIVARAGFNTLTEILILKKPSLLIFEKNNPEIEQNLKQITKLKYAGIMYQTSFKSKFKKRIDFFLKKEIINLKDRLKSKNFKSNGSNQIVREILRNYE